MDLWCLFCLSRGKWVPADTICAGDALCDRDAVLTIGDRNGVDEERVNAAIGELSGTRGQRRR